MNNAIDKKIKEIRGEKECPIRDNCYGSGCERLCRAETVEGKSHLACLKKHPEECIFSMSLRDAYYCKCPFRMLIVRKLQNETGTC